MALSAHEMQYLNTADGWYYLDGLLTIGPETTKDALQHAVAEETNGEHGVDPRAGEAEAN